MALTQSLIFSEADAHPFFPSIECVAIERVACTEPSAYGLEITRWDCRTLQQIVIEEAIVDSIHYTTVARCGWPMPVRQPTGVALGRPQSLTLNSSSGGPGPLVR